MGVPPDLLVSPTIVPVPNILLMDGFLFRWGFDNNHLCTLMPFGAAVHPIIPRWRGERGELTPCGRTGTECVSERVRA